MILISRIISYLFHPIFMPLYGAILMVGIPGESRIYNSLNIISLSEFILLSLIIPIGSILIMKHYHFISALSIPNKEERFYPYLITLCSYILLFFLFKNTTPLNHIILAIGSCILCVWLINIFWKISAHMAGMGGLIGIYCFFIGHNNLVNSSLLVLILLSVLIGYCRYVLKCHSLMQLCAGFILGLANIYVVEHYLGHFEMF